MRSDLTDITLVIDRSGSMEEIRTDAEGGVNAFIREQAQQPGEALLTLVQFDDEHEFVHRGVPIKQAPPTRWCPREARPCSTPWDGRSTRRANGSRGCPKPTVLGLLSSSS